MKGGPGANTQGSSQGLDAFPKEGHYEQIYVPTRVGGKGQDSKVNGKMGDSGSSSQVDSADGLVTGGGLLPYSEVLTQYQNEALENLEAQAIPDGLKDIIKNYFLGLSGE
jgi:hypothetical protein